MRQELVDRLITDKNLPSIEEIEKRYPKRDLPKGAMVTRIAPSPTGFMHIGTVYMGMLSKKMAVQSNGVFILRIEDTDQKREIEGARSIIDFYLREYSILTKLDEHPAIISKINKEKHLLEENGKYGPYIQSQRGDIYKAYIKDMLTKDLAYPCFCSSEDLDNLRTMQKKDDIRTGYYGHYAKCRNLTEEEIIEKLDAGLSCVIRFKSTGRHSEKILIEDLVRGKRNLSDNDFDIPILKGDGLPSYHFAHLIDDYLMGTTHVLRGDEWFSSLPLHLQLFKTMGWEAPAYAHVSPIEKMDGDSRRKLSKRKDPESSVTYYDEEGYPSEAVLEYLMNLANSDFESWRKQNPTLPLDDFELKLNKLNKSGALFDFDKLNHVSQNYISRLTKEDVYNKLKNWSRENNPNLFTRLNGHKDTEYILDIINIERENTNKPRKDIIKWADAWKSIGYFFDDEFNLTKEQALELLPNLNEEEIKNIVTDFVKDYDKNIAKEKQEWFEDFKLLAEKHNFAINGKEFQANPDKFKGLMADFAKIFRVLLTGSIQSPDLYYTMKCMGEERVFNRLKIM